MWREHGRPVDVSSDKRPRNVFIPSNTTISQAVYYSMFLYYCVFSCSTRFSASLQRILTLNWKHLQCFQPPKYNFRSPVSLWKLCSMWSSPPTGYLSFSIVSKSKKKKKIKSIDVKWKASCWSAVMLRKRLNETRPLETMAVIYHEQNAVENTHVHTSIPLNRCELCNLWHRKIFHKFTGENLACSHAPLLCWRAHRRWNNTQ